MWPFMPGFAGAQTTEATPVEPTPAERSAMAGRVAAFMQQYTVPGFSVAIGRSGRLLYQEAFGWADREAGEAATTAHLFRICSISKPITSVAVFTLVEAGRLRLEDKVFGPDGLLGIDYEKPPYEDHLPEITVEHLLTHTSGAWPNNSVDPMFDRKDLTQAELIDTTLRYQAPVDRPGYSFAYSNFGYCLLGRVIERIAGRPYAEFVRESVLNRCGISDMTIGGNTPDERRRGEVKYYGQNGENPYLWNVTRLDSCGGWLACPGDLVRFAMHVSGFPEPANILKPETIVRMTTASAQKATYAKGWAVNAAGTWWHEGSLPGSTAIMVRTITGFCWAAVANTRDKRIAESVMLENTFKLLRAMVGEVHAWRA
jgi:CubicO group peptidase (beta-lactamase class C family)